MKFRVSSKDFTIFVVFCVFLLYLCAIAVLNFSSFADDGSFYGLNPFPAFGKDYIVLTLFMFAVALVIIFSSVSSYIFDKDKNGKKFLNIGFLMKMVICLQAGTMVDIFMKMLMD